MKTLDALMGLCVGDALGVPVEFLSRASLKANPVTDMRGFGTHRQPAGTWSDDSSLAFCLADSLCDGYDVEDIAQKCVLWYKNAYWTPDGKVFDIGIATSRALYKVAQGTSGLLSGGTAENDNGNGSLMRVLPLVFYLVGKPIEERFRLVGEVSSITHAHIRSILGCFIYCEYALLLLAGKEKGAAYLQMQESVRDFLSKTDINPSEISKYHRVLGLQVGEYEVESLEKCDEAQISSSGYVVSTLEAAFWCFLRADDYAETVLSAVNLGEDTDTVACVAGGLAGLYYGVGAIPAHWREKIIRKAAIEQLAQRLEASLCV